VLKREPILRQWRCWSMRDWIVDIACWVGAFVVSTAVGYWLHTQGVDVPSLPEWLTGL
jgi:hypothetical protein